MGGRDSCLCCPLLSGTRFLSHCPPPRPPDMAHPCIKSPPVFPGLGCLSLTLSPRRTFFSDSSQSLLLDGAIPASHLSPQAPPPAPVADADRPPVIAALRSIASSAFPATLSLPPPATLCFWRGRACSLPIPPMPAWPPPRTEGSQGWTGLPWVLKVVWLLAFVLQTWTQVLCASGPQSDTQTPGKWDPRAPRPV